MRERGEEGGLLNAYLHAPLGLLIVSFHWLWSWPAAFVTLIGCALTLKGLLYFVWPGLALRSIANVSEERSAGFRAAGVVALLIGLASFWISLGASLPPA